ncbi:unnamed protein product [Pedinophyceae sp. YPF-701]|nr:unnamed protein product [Pedinophyceae sp. YPF-701]
MGRGLSARRRAKRQLAANESNLYKAQFGKASAFALAKLEGEIDAKKEREYVPRSMRRMMELDEVARAKKAERLAKQQGLAGSAPGAANAGSRDKATAPASSDKASPADEKAGKAAAAGGDSDGETGGKDQDARQGEGEKTRGGAKKGGRESERLFAKTKKERRREHLKLKKKLKKSKRQGRNDGAEDELPSDNVAFGEVVHNVPSFNLKRRHWAKAEAASQRKGHQAPSKGAKLGDLLARRIEEAEARTGVKASSDVFKKRTGGKEKPVGLRAKAQQEALREEAIQAYRATKLARIQRTGGSTQGLKVGQATAQSLRRLAQQPDSMRDG